MPGCIQTSMLSVKVIVGFMLCLIRCFLSDEESLELAWLWNHRKFSMKKVT